MATTITAELPLWVLVLSLLLVMATGVCIGAAVTTFTMGRWLRDAHVRMAEAHVDMRAAHVEMRAARGEFADALRRVKGDA